MFNGSTDRSGDLELYTMNIDGKQYVMSIQKKKTYLPFTIELIDFKKVMHPGTEVAKAYSSKINLIENNIPRSVLIEMNKPLRHKVRACTS